jgi:hypothetical protein
MRCAMLGDMIAEAGTHNGWAGIIVYGCIRDSKVSLPPSLSLTLSLPLKLSFSRTHARSLALFHGVSR